ncbi:MAG: hypothetical protein ACREHC_09085 [Candidatus Levyibacteriota bacterium]
MSIFPVWLCPLQATHAPQKLSPHYLKEKQLLDVGIWGRIPEGKGGIKKINRDFEGYIKKFGGRKMFYANSYYSEEEFWRIYDKKWYANLRKKYKAEKIFPNIWQKVHTYKEYKIQKWRILKTMIKVFLS